jgi:hypothetical protein
MATLTTKARKAIPSSRFALSGRRYPIENRRHAADAKARATQEVAAGKLSSANAATIRRKANRVLGERGARSTGRYPVTVHKSPSCGTHCSRKGIQ